MNNNKRACSIEWILIPDPHLEKARVFYREVFNFLITDYNDTFLVFKASNISGGLDSTLVPSQNSLSFSITVDDISKTLKRVEKFAGRIIRDKYSLGQNPGFCAQFADPNGNILELYSAV